MLKSMTAYGRGQAAAQLGRFVVEIQSVNRKFLDVAINLPRELHCFDPILRKWVGGSMQRGRVSVTVKAAFEGAGPVKVEPNLGLVNQVLEAWRSIQTSCGISGELSAQSLLEMDGVLNSVVDLNDESAYQNLLKDAFDSAINSFMAMQLGEGRALELDIRGRLDVIREKIESIAPLTKGACERQRSKLIARIQDVIPGVECDDRVLREVALFADRIDIEEELIRVRSHLDQFEKYLHSEGSMGKTFDFLLQELFREANTMASKVSDLAASHLVVEIKGELERIREQVQNVE
jgi:uncharacterized protein (TIGR00255 family)